MSDNGVNKRIAQNTVMLYFRMFFSMIVTLYTSRVLLDALGVEDFGIYNVVGGVVIMLGFLNNAMAASTQRFLTFALGKQELDKIRKVFNMSITIHIIIAFCIVLLAETVGLWFLNNKLSIPFDRLFAANWVYQFSILSFIASVLSVPYNAAIIANEKMKIFAVVGIIEVVLKLLIVLIVMALPYDELIAYGLLLSFVSVVVGGFYFTYCRKTFEESKGYYFNWDKNLFKEMGNFASWNLLGVTAGIGYNQGVNILLNIFFGPTVNAARGIAFQVQGAVSRFVTNFQIAVNPSITKLYAQGEMTSSFNLVFSSSKLSFYLLLFLSLPILLQTDVILGLWLKQVPDYTVVFTQLVLIDILIGSLSGPLQILAQATGEIRKYQIYVSGILLLNLPTSYIFLKLGYLPESTMFISIFFTFIALWMRLRILNQMASFPMAQFLKDIVLKVGIITSVSLAPALLFKMNTSDSFWNFIIVVSLSILSTIISILAFGLNKEEKKLFKEFYFKLKIKFQQN